MKTRLVNLWDTVRTSLWFVPTLVTGGFIALSFLLVALDRAAPDPVTRALAWAYTGGAEGARSILSTIAGSIITVAGVTFSITIAALSLASQQFGPRLLRNFLRDTGNQLVLGTFIGTFLYCLLVLRTLGGGDNRDFVPHLSVTLGVALATLSLGVLIYFIHHMAASIQASHVITVVSRDLDRAIDDLFPATVGQDAPEPGPRQEKDACRCAGRETCHPVLSTERGYLQGVDCDRLMRIAVEHDLCIRLAYRPGSFVVRGGQIARICPGDRVDGELPRKINAALVLGPQRTLTQDVEFAVNQLVEVAVRALSPGINDPFTAVACVDHLGEALCHLARRAFPSPFRHDASGTLRVITPAVTFDGVTDAAFHQIRQYGRSSAPVMIRLLETIATVAAYLRTEEQRAALRRHVELIAQDGQEALPTEADRKDLAERCQRALQALEPR